jgi:hypothetical protein
MPPPAFRRMSWQRVYAYTVDKDSSDWVMVAVRFELFLGRMLPPVNPSG